MTKIEIDDSQAGFGWDEILSDSFATSTATFDYNPDQARDEHGRWAGDGVITLGDIALVLRGDPDGDGTREHPIYVGKDLDRAVELMALGKSVRLDSTKEASIVVSKMGDYARQLRDLGQKAPTFDLCGITVADTNVFCVDPETEILTAEGWRKYNTLRVGDTVLTLNHKTGLSEWQPLDAVNIFAAAPRPMLRMKWVGHSSLTTMDHRWPVITKGGVRRWRTSSTLGWDDYIPIAAPCADLPVDPKYADALVELVAWAWTEGTLPSKSTLRIYQSHMQNQPYCDQIRAALYVLYGPAFDGDMRSLKKRGPKNRMGARDGTPAWRATRDEATGMTAFHLNAAASEPILAHLGPDKVVSPGFVTELTLAQLHLFIDRSMNADGTISKKGTRSLSQRVEERNRSFELACILSGQATSTSAFPEIRPDRKAGLTQFYTTIRKRSAILPKTTDRKRMEAVTYDGIVWCPTVANESWLARREGTVYFTGNCKDTLGLPRIEMPQLSGVARDGTLAAGLRKDPENSNERVDVTAAYLTSLTESGVRISDKTVDASMLRPSQGELNGGKTGVILQNLLMGKEGADKSIWITKDGYVLDGHHRWAATLAKGYLDGTNETMHVREIGMDIGAAIDYTREFSEKAGIIRAHASVFRAARLAPFIIEYDLADRTAAFAAQLRAAFEYDPNQPRDEKGRWGEKDGGGPKTEAEAKGPSDFERARSERLHAEAVESQTKAIGPISEVQDRLNAGLPPAARITDLHYTASHGHGFPLIVGTFNGQGELEIGGGTAKWTGVPHSDGSGDPIHINTIDIPPELQGQGVAKELLGNIRGLVEDRGGKGLFLIANIDVGAYAWAKFGFSPKGEPDAVYLAHKLGVRLAESPPLLSTESRAVVDRAVAELKDGNSKALWDIVDEPGTFPLLQGTRTNEAGLDWYGELMFDDTEAMARFESYIGKK